MFTDAKREKENGSPLKSLNFRRSWSHQLDDFLIAYDAYAYADLTTKFKCKMVSDEYQFSVTWFSLFFGTASTCSPYFFVSSFEVMLLLHSAN